MKLYKKCNKCHGVGWLHARLDLTADPCSECNTHGYIEVDAPIEQMLEALKEVENFYDEYDYGLVVEAIKAAEEFIK